MQVSMPAMWSCSHARSFAMNVIGFNKHAKWDFYKQNLFRFVSGIEN